MKGRIPRCCPGRLLSPKQASSLALSYPMKMKRGFPQPDLPRHRLRHREECCRYTMKGVKKLRSPGEIHAHMSRFRKQVSCCFGHGGVSSRGRRRWDRTSLCGASVRCSSV